MVDARNNLQLIATIFLGIVATLVVYLQVRIAKAKLKSELYDRRYLVSRRLMAFINKAQGAVVPDDEFGRRVRRLEQGQLLFKKKPLRDWLTRVRRDLRATNKLRRLISEHRHRQGESDKSVYEAHKKYARLTQSLDKDEEAALELFRPYLDFSKNR